MELTPWEIAEVEMPYHKIISLFRISGKIIRSCRGSSDKVDKSIIK
jgi:hypothetical protein